MWNATAKLNPDQEFVPRQSSFTEWLQQVRERRKSPTPEPYQVAYYPVQFDSEPPRPPALLRTDPGGISIRLRT